jgi:hypothetical protein
MDPDHPGRDRPAFALGQQPMRHVELFWRQGARRANTLSAPPGDPHPCLFRSRINSRSNSAKAANTPRLNRPSGRVVSMAAHSPVSIFEVDTAPLQIINNADQLRHGPAKSVELPDVEHIAGLAGRKGVDQAGPMRRGAR